MKRLMVLAMLLGGCAVYQPGSGVTIPLASRWGCDYVDVMERAEERKTGKSDTEVWIPQIGWDACELLASNGAPTSVDYQQIQGGPRSASWWYQEPNAETHLVSLEQRGARGRWFVTYVGW